MSSGSIDWNILQVFQSQHVINVRYVAPQLSMVHDPHVHLYIEHVSSNIIGVLCLTRNILWHEHSGSGPNSRNGGKWRGIYLKSLGAADCGLLIYAINGRLTGLVRRSPGAHEEFVAKGAYLCMHTYVDMYIPPLIRS